MKSTLFKKVFENNVDDKETFADDTDLQMSKVLQGANRAFFAETSRMLKNVEYKCKVIPNTSFHSTSSKKFEILIIIIH